MSRHVADLEKSKFKQYANFKTAIRTTEVNKYKAIQGKKTSVGTTATFINTPENSDNFILYHVTSGVTLYIGDNNSITTSSDNVIPIEAGLSNGYKFRGRKNNNNRIYGIVASGSLDVYVGGNY